MANIYFTRNPSLCFSLKNRKKPQILIIKEEVKKIARTLKPAEGAHVHASVLQSNDSAHTIFARIETYLYFFAVYFHGSYCKIYTDRRSLGRCEKSLSESLNQASFPYVRITNQDNFKQVAVIVHFAVGQVRRFKSCTICEP